MKLSLLSLCSLLFLAAFVSACSSNPPVTAGPGEADQLLLDRGNAALKERKWATARQYFSELLESYPQSPLRAEAKLGVGDSYLGENNSAAYVYAQNEYREFLAFYPTNPRADYAQMQLGMVHFNQMLNPQRDQSETKEAIKEFQVFVDRYPNSPLMPQVQAAPARVQGSAVGLGHGGRDDLPEDAPLLGRRAAVSLRARNRPRILAIRDSLYFHLAETLEKSDRKAEALPYYERLVKEFEQSEHLEEAKKRIETLKAGVKPVSEGP